jgi:glutamine synthetase
MLGSSQNIALPNVVLNTAVAESFKQFADILEAAENFDEALAKLLRDTFTQHRRILFDGNGYSEEWEKEAEKRGLLNLRSSVDAYKCFNLEKNVKLFTEHGVMSKVEIDSREDILFENYSKIINIEALTMIEMASRDILPSVNAYIAELADSVSAKLAVMPKLPCTMERSLIEKLSGLIESAYKNLEKLREVESCAAKISDNVKKAEAYRETVIPVMEALRADVDEMETHTASEFWPLPTYGDMMFRV